MIKNAQALFNRVVAHAKTMPQKARDLQNRCVYKTEDGRKCFIGGIIPKGKYKPEFDDMDTLSQDVFNKIGIDGSLHDLARRLQNVHDRFCLGDWGQELEIIANNFGLKFNVKRFEKTRVKRVFAD